MPTEVYEVNSACAVGVLIHVDRELKQLLIVTKDMATTQDNQRRRAHPILTNLDADAASSTSTTLPRSLTILTMQD